MHEPPCGRPRESTGGRRCAICGEPPPTAEPDELYWCAGPPGASTVTDEATAAGADTPLVPGFGIHGVLGSGASATVYRAWSETLARDVALKVFHGPRLGTAASRLEREGVHGTRALDGLVQVVATGEAAGTPWLAMECVDGPTLGALLRPPRPPLRLLVRLVAQTARIVDRLHRAGVVHRDLKPSNILVHQDGRPVVADLGLAMGADESRLTRTGAILGTLRYMAPEQAAGEVTDWPKVDVHALGVTLAEVMGGAEDADLQAIARRATASDARQRTGTAAQLARELELWLDGRRITLWLSVPRVRRGLTLAAVALLGIGAAFAAAPRPLPPPPPTGWWTFDAGREAVDLAGNHAPLQLGGTAQIAAGRLDVDAVGGQATGWASVEGPEPGVPSTVVARVSLDSAAHGGLGGLGVPVSLDSFGLGDADIGRVRTLAWVRLRLEDGKVLSTSCRDGIEVHRVVAEDEPGRDEGLRLWGLDAHVDELRFFDAALDCATTTRLPTPPTPEGPPRAVAREPAREPGHDSLEAALATGVAAGWTLGWAPAPGEALRPLRPGAFGALSFWRATRGDWLGLYTNRSGAPVEAEVGLVLPPGAVLLHPGREGEWAVARFAPAWPGRYRVSLHAAPVDTGAAGKATAAELRVDGTTVARAALALDAPLLVSEELALCKEAAVFVGDGGDGYADDSVRLQLGVAWLSGPDPDGDSVLEPCDRCPERGTGGFDADRDGCVDDTDDDGVPDDEDTCVGRDEAGDPDGDGVCSDRDGDQHEAWLGLPSWLGG